METENKIRDKKDLGWFARLINWFTHFFCWSSIFKKFEVNDEGNISAQNITEDQFENDISQQNNSSQQLATNSENINLPEDLDIDLTKEQQFAKNLAKTKQIDSYDKNGWTPLYAACVHRNYKVAEALLKYGANSNVRTRSSGQTALYATVGLALSCITLNKKEKFQDYFKLTELLLKSGANTNVSTRGGDSPLSIICNNELLDDDKYDIESHKKLATLLIENSKIFNDKITGSLWSIHNSANNETITEFVEKNLPDCKIQFTGDISEIEKAYKIAG